MFSAKTEIIWKQVRILHGPATVLKEFLSICHCKDRFSPYEKAERSDDS